MPINLILPVADVDSIIGTASNQFNNIRLYSSPTRGGTYTLLTTVLLVSGTTQYPFTDNAGASTTWYKITFYNSVTANETPLTEAQPFPATRGTTSLQTLRQMVIRNLGGEVYTPSDYTAQTATSLTLIDTAIDSNWFNGWHIYRSAQKGTNDQDKRVSSFSNSTGQLTHAGTPYLTTAVGTEVIELCPVDITLDEMNRKIGQGLERARYLYRWEFGAQSAVRQYNLPSFVEGAEFVPEMWKRFGTVSGNGFEWQPFSEFGRFWRVRGSRFKCTLDINPPQSDNDVLALDIWRPGEALDGDTDFTLVHELWAEAAAMVSVLEWLVNRDIMRHQQSAFDKILASWVMNLRQRSRTYGPTGGMKIQLLQPFRGFPEI